MLKFRIKIIECVMSSVKPAMVEKLILEVIQQKIQKGISAKRILQTISVLESDMLFQIRLNHTAKEINNIKEALRIIKAGINVNN